MTKEEILGLITENLPDNDEKLITPAKVRDVMSAIVGAIPAEREYFPKGIVVMWSGAIGDIPAGFALCNGQTVAGFGTVPDLRRRFIVGFDSGAPTSPADTNATGLTDAQRLTENYGATGNRGGKANVALATNQLPDFTLSIPGRWGRDDMNFTDTGAFASSDRYEPETAWSLTQKYSRNKSSSEYGQPHENRPPYYVLAFIIKVE